MRLSFVELHPYTLMDPGYEPTLGARPHGGFPDADIQDVVGALGLNQVNLCRNITSSLAPLYQHRLGPHTQREIVLPCGGEAPLHLIGADERMV